MIHVCLTLRDQNYSVILNNTKSQQNQNLPLKAAPLQKVITGSPFRQKVLEKKRPQAT